MQVLKQLTTISWTFTIPINQSVSNGIDIESVAPRGLQVVLPSAWTAADVALEVSSDNVTWIPVEKMEGTKVKLLNVPTTASPSPTRIFEAEAWAIGCWKYLRLASVSTSNEDTYVTQAAARTFVGKPLS